MKERNQATGWMGRREKEREREGQKILIIFFRVASDRIVALL